ncbi:hypothetical protein LCGC14_1877460 [marine sediment metagenome]|uniref:Radical SAM core domain-containing protein n=1 Tax=marine sediment metagenome TaxID=412755 RepID=A0A0F9G363_9ZZZZ
MEWSNASRYNSFNSMKGLTYYEHYRKILAWMDGKGGLPPPIECNLDPYVGCNLSCYFCITQRYLRTTPEEVGPMRMLPDEYMYRLVDFLAAWGVKGLCISGGGEPTLHSGTWGLPQYAVSKGMEASFVTNATKMNQLIAEGLRACQWVSLSVDAAYRHTYQLVKGADMFDRVVANIKYLVSQKGNSQTFLIFKMVVLPENYQQIHDACKLAKGLGLSGFHVRPVDFERDDIVGHRRLDLPIDFIKEQFARCHEEETDDFKVFTVTHKFDPQFHTIHEFSRCLSTPLLIPILTDGNVYLCVDKKMEAAHRLGSAYPDPEQILTWWGSDRHRELIKSVDITRCSRCTFSQYNIQVEKAVVEDRMMLAFP